MEKEEVKISVRDIVEFILRSGDIDNRRGGWADKESLAKGTRIHKKIQRQMGAAYQAEVPLSYRFCYEDLDILVEGRADGIEEKEDHVMVDEIKGVHRDLGKMLCGNLYGTESAGTDGSADDLLQYGDRGDPPVFLSV